MNLFEQYRAAIEKAKRDERQGERRSRRNQGSRRKKGNRQALQMQALLAQQLRGQSSGSPLDTEGYRQGMGSLRDNLLRLGQQDQRAAAARGMAGGEQAIAALGARNQALVSGQRGLAGQSEQFQAQRQRMLQSLLGQQVGQNLQQQGIDQNDKYRRMNYELDEDRFDFQRESFDRQMEEQRRARRAALFGSLFQGLTNLVPG